MVTVKCAEGFDVRRLILSPYLCKKFARVPAETGWVYFKIILAMTRQPDLVQAPFSEGRGENNCLIKC